MPTGTQRHYNSLHGSETNVLYEGLLQRYKNGRGVRRLVANITVRTAPLLRSSRAHKNVSELALAGMTGVIRPVFGAVRERIIA